MTVVRLATLVNVWSVLLNIWAVLLDSPDSTALTLIWLRRASVCWCTNCLIHR